MFNSVISIAITLVFIFLLLAVMVTAINEFIFTLRRSRATQLESFLAKLFFEDTQWNQVFEKIRHSPFINVLKKESDQFPAAIPAENFAKALLAHLGNNNLSYKAIEDCVRDNKDADSEFFRMMKALLSQTRTYEELQAEIEKIFNAAMDRLTGWYKRKAKIMSFVIGFLICAALNVDTINVTDNLWHNKDKAEQISAFAITASKYFEKNDSSQLVFRSGIDTLATISSGNPLLRNSLPGKAVSSLDTTGNAVPQKQLVRSYSLLSSLDLPIGWSSDNVPLTKGNSLRIIMMWLLKFLGILLTTAAVSLGAPYWFDILNKITPLKQTTPKSPDTAGGGSGK